MILAEVFDPLNKPQTRRSQTVLVIDHMPTGHLWHRDDFLRPTHDLRCLGRIEEAACDQESIAFETREVRHLHGAVGGKVPQGSGGVVSLGRRDVRHAIKLGKTPLRAFSASSRKSISIQGRPLMSSNPKSRGPLAKIISRISSSYSMSRRPWVT